MTIFGNIWILRYWSDEIELDMTHIIFLAHKKGKLRASIANHASGHGVQRIAEQYIGLNYAHKYIMFDGK